MALNATLHLPAEQLDAFLEAIEENAQRSFTDGPACRHFDVSQDAARTTHFIFHEACEDEAALKAHRTAPHFAAWRQAPERCVVRGRQVNAVCRRLLRFACLRCVARMAGADPGRPAGRVARCSGRALPGRGLARPRATSDYRYCG